LLEATWAIKKDEFFEEIRRLRNRKEKA